MTISPQIKILVVFLKKLLLLSMIVLSVELMADEARLPEVSEDFCAAVQKQKSGNLSQYLLPHASTLR